MVRLEALNDFVQAEDFAPLLLQFLQGLVKVIVLRLISHLSLQGFEMLVHVIYLCHSKLGLCRY